MALIVELAGLPSAGKSTFVAEIEQCLRSSGIEVVRRLPNRHRRLLEKAAAAWRYRRALLAATRAMVSDSRPMKRRIVALRWLLTTLQLHTLGRTIGPGVVVLLQEGVVQRALLTCLDVGQNLVSRHLADYARATPKPDLVVFLDLDPSVAVTRHLTRSRESDKYPHRFDLEPESLMTAMHTSDRLLREVLSKMEARYGVIVSKVNALDRPSSRRDLHADILPQIEHLLSTG